MRIEAACFSARGIDLAQRLLLSLEGSEWSMGICRCGDGGPSVHAWTAKHFFRADALLFISATGIAVRAVAPHLQSKMTDPAVVTMDEKGQYVIPLLSGHIGGANRLAAHIARLLDGKAVAVITTATDINQIFAVDSWAKENGYSIQNPKRIKVVSAKLLDGKTASIQSDFPIDGLLPEALFLSRETDAVDIRFTYREKSDWSESLCLSPPVLVLGVGCRKGTLKTDLEGAFFQVCTAHGLWPGAFSSVCSIDLKKEEAGLLAFCANHGWPLRTFSAEVLQKAPGEFSGSAFVSSVTGVDNVCERSAVLGSGGKLVVKKFVVGGITIAVAAKPWTVRFEDKR